MPVRSGVIGQRAKSGTMMAIWPFARHHRIGLVGGTLKAGARMRVNVGHDGELALAAQRPQFGERIAVQHAHAGVVGARVEIVVEDRVSDFEAAVPLAPQQEHAGFVAPLASPLEFGDERLPAGIGTAEAMLRCPPRPNNRYDGKAHKFAPGSR